MAVRGSRTRDSYGVLQENTCIAAQIGLQDESNGITIVMQGKLSLLQGSLEAVDSQLSCKASSEEDF